jgi:formamidase
MQPRRDFSVPDVLIPIDLRRSPEEQSPRPHNRWHPEIPAVATVEPGAVFRLECLDLTGGQIVNGDSADDVRGLDLTQVNYMTGPVAVAGARPGDLLVVDVLDVGPLAGAEWGFTGVLERESGTGLLPDDFPHARKAIWDLNGVYASSRHVEGVRFAGIPHPGILGCAPSHELLARWNRREAALFSAHGIRFPAAAALPLEQGALLGDLSRARHGEIARGAARSWAARENGGNMEVKELSRGARAYLPVYVPGANLSVGDLHFSQGDGKITGLGGVKMAGWIDLRVDLVPDGMERMAVHSPVFQPGPVEPAYGEYLTFQGISVDEEDTQHFLDVWVSYRVAARHAIRYLERFGYSGEQAYVLLSAAPVQGRLSCMLEHPNVCTTLAVPRAIFEFDPMPDGTPPPAEPRGELAR